MLYDMNTDKGNNENEFRQRVADQGIQSVEERQEEIRHAKNGFIGMLAGIVVGGAVGWLFLSPVENVSKEREIPVIRRPLTPAKIQPNDPGGMEIDNQDREIYHIVDNTPKPIGEVNIVPVPEVPQLVVENSMSAPENIENLVASIEEEGSLDNKTAELSETENIKVADSELIAIKTNSAEKVKIPEKIKEIDVKPQNTIKNDNKPTAASTPVAPVQAASAKGTWYTQIIASSNKKSVESLWKQLSGKHAFLREYTHEIEEITAANGSTLYRLKVGAFKTRKEAEALSDKMKSNQISSIIKQN